MSDLHHSDAWCPRRCVPPYGYWDSNLGARPAVLLTTKPTLRAWVLAFAGTGCGRSGHFLCSLDINQAELCWFQFKGTKERC